MKLDRRWIVASSVLAAVALTAIAVLAGGNGEALGSSVSRGPSGWLAARKYLEARGAQVTLWREPLERFSGEETLVVAFPWQHGQGPNASDALEAHLQRGGDLVLAWSGGSSSGPETVVLEELGLTPDEVRKAPLNPFTFRKFVKEEWELTPENPRPPAPSPTRTPFPPGEGETRALRIWAPRRMPALPGNLEVLYRTPTGKPAVVRWSKYRGSIWLLPADALSNARLGQAGNADLLEILLARLGRTWTFDEYHHGLVAVETEGSRAFERILDLVLIHLAILYALALVTLSRRFGPPWKETPAVTGSVGSFLAGLGTLHHKLRHHPAAARRLLERTRELAPDLAIPDELERRAETARPEDFVEIARTLVQLRRDPQLRRRARSTSSGDRT